MTTTAPTPDHRPGCPDTRQLSAYSLGELPAEQAETIADHVEHCLACEETVRDLEQQGDPLVALLRSPPADDPIFAEPQCQQAVSALLRAGAEPTWPQAAPADGKSQPPTADLGSSGSVPVDPQSAAAAGAEPPPLGLLRDYELLAKLGQGGMGTVYKARHRRLKRLVAIKLLPTGQLDAAAVARFEREMEAAGKVRHENLVEATDAGDHQGTHFLVMEYLSGCDGAQLAAQVGPLAVPEACEIVRQAALGLQCVHEHGLVHRDVKPSNLMLSADPKSGAVRIKLLDLGLARLTEAQAPADLTNSGQVMGTLDYMAPEQVSDAHRVDARADLYSLGATLYRLLAGVSVYHGLGFTTTLQKLYALGQTPPPSITSRRADLPAELAALVDRLLTRDPALRPQSAADVAEQLARWSQGHQLEALLARCQLPQNATVARATPAMRAADAPRLAGLDLQALSSAPPQSVVAASLATSPGGGPAVPARRWRFWPATGRTWAIAGSVAMLLVVGATFFAWWARTRTSGNLVFTENSQVLPDPGVLVNLPLQAGQTYYFDVTGNNQGYVWGTDIYTTDSTLASAAVHAGALGLGERGVIRVLIVPGLQQHSGSVRNGIQTQPWGSYSLSYVVERRAAAAATGSDPSPTITSTLDPSAAALPAEPSFTADVVGQLTGSVWGTDIYTSDSTLGAVAVHAGLLKPGETKRLRIIYLDGQSSYVGSTRNGVISTSYSSWPQSMRVELATSATTGASSAELSIDRTIRAYDPTGVDFVQVPPYTVRFYRLQGRIDGYVWGDGIYTTDSDLSAAAVHAGALKLGQSGVVKVTFLPGQAAYGASQKNGVTTNSWSNYSTSFRVELARPEELAPEKSQP